MDPRQRAIIKTWFPKAIVAQGWKLGVNKLYRKVGSQVRSRA